MKSSEEAVRRVLEGLRDVEAPAGMESRIVLALERRTAEPAQQRKVLSPSSIAMRSLATGAAFAAMACAVLWMPKAHRSAPMASVSHVVQGLAPAEGLSTPTLPPKRAEGRLHRAQEVMASAENSSDALALAETRAPSRPDPPLPLTEQEKLLLRVAHRHDPEQMAMLNPEMRSRRQLQAAVEFKEFFEPARPLEENRNTDSTDKRGDTR